MSFSETTPADLDINQTLTYENYRAGDRVRLRHLLWQKPVRKECELRLVDYDGTILDEEHRFRALPGLRQNRGNLAYSFLLNHFESVVADILDDPSAPGEAKWRETVKLFIKALDPAKGLLDGYEAFYDPDSADHILLTAGDTQIQRQKIEATWPEKSPLKIIVSEAYQKPIAILELLSRLEELPEVIEFYDDRMDENFAGLAQWLADLLPSGCEVRLYQARARNGSVTTTLSEQAFSPERLTL